MLDTLNVLPPSFWVVILLLGGGGYWAFGRVRSGLGLPVLVVLATVSTWYVVDVLYNDYLQTYVPEFTSKALDEAWWQVALFLVVFLFLALPVHEWINQRYLKRSSQVWQLSKGGYDKPHLQAGLRTLLLGCYSVWAILSVGAALRIHAAVLYYFCPYLSYLADPWARDRIGAGFDFVWTTALHLHMFVAAMFGILLALITNPKLRALALFGVLTSWPYLIFGRTRNYMLAAVIPGVLAWVFLRFRAHFVIKLVVLAALFSIVSAWFGFVMAHRSEETITSALNEEGFDLGKSSEIHHEGLNMFEELCWINTFIDQGIYTPNEGKRYLAEIVNPIPRTIWPGKPMIGIDYAILRGQSYEEGSAGVGATISTGMIGQGVVNFGQILGPSFAALLMSIWAAILARLDLNGQEIGRIPLYALGLLLTFNLGRDITLLTLYTFVFGAMLIWLAEQMSDRNIVPARTRSRSHAAKPSAGPDGEAVQAKTIPAENSAALSSPSGGPTYGKLKQGIPAGANNRHLR